MCHGSLDLPWIGDCSGVLQHSVALESTVTMEAAGSTVKGDSGTFVSYVVDSVSSIIRTLLMPGN